MSLINRMLRDLSARKPEAGNVMSGIQVRADAPARQGALTRLVALIALVGVFTLGLWWMFGPRTAKLPQPPAVAQAAPAAQTSAVPAAPVPPPAEQVAAAATPAEPVDGTPTPPPAAAPPPAETPPPARLKMDTDLSAPPAEAPARKAKPRSTQSKPKPAVAPAAPKVTEPEAAPTEPGTDTAARAAVPATSPQTETQEAAKVATPPVAGSRPAAEQRYADGRRALEIGDEKGAELGFTDALELDPKLHAAREDLGNLRIRQGRYADAERAVRRGLEEDPAWLGYRRLMARLELARGHPEGAVQALEGNLPPVASDIEYHALLASAYQRMSRHEDAARTYQGLAQAQPDRAVWWAGYGLSRDALGDASGALAAYARARQLGGLDPRVLEHINRRSAALQAAG